MSWSKIIKSTLKKEKAAIILYLMNTVFLIIFYYLLYGNKLETYPLILTLAGIVVYLFYKVMVYKKLYQILEEGKSSPQYSREIAYEYGDILDYLRDIHKSYIAKLYNLKSKEEEKDRLMSQWIHNMKTSISVIKLAADKGLDNKEGHQEIFKDIINENYKLEYSLEGALNVFRLEEFSKDFMPEKVNLKELVTAAVNSKKINFIYAKVFPKVTVNNKILVYTDKKWGRYVIEQVLSNAIKYSNNENATVNINAVEKEGKVKLIIKDEGIGIKKEYINRVFDLFFTGDNGRENKNSTGIGLYMCKLICEKLNNEINIESEEGKGTEVIISYINAKN